MDEDGGTEGFGKLIVLIVSTPTICTSIPFNVLFIPATSLSCLPARSPASFSFCLIRSNLSTISFLSFFSALLWSSDWRAEWSAWRVFGALSLNGSLSEGGRVGFGGVFVREEGSVLGEFLK